MNSYDMNLNSELLKFRIIEIKHYFNNLLILIVI